MAEKLDIGCGRNKQPDYIGIDTFDFPGVDAVWDLEKFPWPFEDNRFSYVKANHIVEHINDQVGFFREINRVSKDGAIVHLETPHFSSNNSWADPTHVKHFSMFFIDEFIGEGYLARAVGKFDLVHRRVSFGSALFSLRARLTVFLLGYRRWERNAFKMPARNIFIDLKVCK